MTLCKTVREQHSRRSLLLIGVSVATLASGLAARPAQAQTMAAVMAKQGARTQVQAAIPSASATPNRPATMNQAFDRQRATQSRAEQIRSYVTSARDAAIAANRANVTDGLAAGGLDPTAAIRDAVAAARAGDTAKANQLLVSAAAVNDATGLKTWEGAGLPGQTTVDGRTVVSIDQTQSRALLSWNSFNVGANTTLQFNQKSNGVAQPGWVAVNRVTNAVAPSQILGNLKADGTVVVLNQSGIIFGQKSQINTHSLLASTLELGDAVKKVGGIQVAASIKDRNGAFIDNGLFLSPNGTFGDQNPIPVLVSASVADDANGVLQYLPTPEGDVVVDRGARITADTGGFLMLTAPRIDSAGVLTATEGQVSLQAGRSVSYVQSTGSATAIDPFVRGYKLNSFYYSGRGSQSTVPTPSDGQVLVSGLIDSPRGYLSLGAGPFGTVTLTGLLSTTTSVSRNGKISLTGGYVKLGGDTNPSHASGIQMLADTNGETIPLGTANAPSGFKTSQLEIGAQELYTPLSGNALASIALLPNNFSMGTNAVIYAPGAYVSIGKPSPTVTAIETAGVAGNIDIASGAVIDVGGLKNVQLDASRNQIQITPVKRNELRDTPNYREVALDGNFSLNGATLYVDPRLSGVRADGVAWVGSPLIEAGSLASQIPVTAAEFMTKAGTLSLSTNALLFNGGTVDPATVPSIRIARDATIDFSGGWVNYAAGAVRTSRLITDDGRVVDIGRADPNDTYVGVSEGYTAIQPRFGIVQTYSNSAAAGVRSESSYDEGRDAGVLSIVAPAVSIDGTLYGNAFAGARQVVAGDRPSLASANGRLVQRGGLELPSGGALSIDSAGDVIVYHGTRGPVASDVSELLLDDRMLSGAGLSRLALNIAGSVTFAGANPVTLQPTGVFSVTGASDLELADGGALTVTAGRTIRFDGTVQAASGSIDALTENDFLGFGSVFRSGLYGTGNGDDINLLYTSEALVPTSPFDVIVSGTLSTAGRWVNDYTETGPLRGGAFSDGGSISIGVAKNAFAGIGAELETVTQVLDLSGSIRIGGLLNVSSGGYVTPKGALDLSGKGGDVTLLDETIYAVLGRTIRGKAGDPEIISDQPFQGSTQSVDFTPIPADAAKRLAAVVPQLVAKPRSVVEIAPGSIKGFGFGGGGTFTLFAPAVSFGSDNSAGSVHIGLDFFKTTGFGTLDVTSYHSRIVPDIFTNPSVNDSAFVETTRFTVGAGETLDLTQWVLPSILTADQNKALRQLGTDADITTQASFAPVKPVFTWDQRAANLTLGGLTELDVLAGGTITGAPDATLAISQLYNAGRIILPGGTISQSAALPQFLASTGTSIGVRDLALGGGGLAEAFGGPVDAFGRFDENAQNAAGVMPGLDIDPVFPKRLLTNAELVSLEGADRIIYFLGKLDAGQGVLLEAGSVTDLSGVALFDPRALVIDGTQVRTGRVLNGGVLQTAAASQNGPKLFPTDPISGPTASVAAKALMIRDNATLDISGTSAVYDQMLGAGRYTPVLQWSAGGTLSALSGGTVGSTPIRARGGAANAAGGTLEWLAPTVGTGGTGTANYLPAAFITASGFDTLAVRSSLRLDGDFTLNLRKALLVTSQQPFNGTLTDSSGRIVLYATAGSDATIAAPYIRFGSRIPDTGSGAAASVGDANVSFLAGRQGIDIVGGLTGDASIASLAFRTPGDVRFTGVSTAVFGALPFFNGALVADSNLTIDAGRTYATTGTGNLQAVLEALPASQAQPYRIAVFGNHTVTFGNSFLDSAAPAPLSAGSYLQVFGQKIVQNGYLAAPLGLLELGSSTSNFQNGGTILPTDSVTFGAGSVTTVSGAGLTIPYGTTTDLIEYYFPTIGTPITAAPTGQLRIAGKSIDEQAGARIDGRGGGDIFAFEFQSGVGGSRDVLDRINRDAFSSNSFDPVTGAGYQYPDQRQVFALVPVSQANQIAPFDPIYSADYGAAGPVDLYGAQAGLSVTLEAGPGIAAGQYLLVPAHYALAIPGALRVVENTDTGAPIPGTSTRLLDGSVIIGGTYSYAGSDIAESMRHAFTVQSKDVFSKYSTLKTTSGSTSIANQAAQQGLARPRLPLDAARVVLSPLNELRVAGVFDTSAAAGGQGGQFDILGSNIIIAEDDSVQTAGALTLADDTLTKLNATSLFIGGQRTDRPDGTTGLAISTRSIEIKGGAVLQAPELLLAVAGSGSQLAVDDGAAVTATGTLGTQPTGNYVVTTTDTSGRYDTTGIGSIVRLANGDERLVTRTGTPGTQSTLKIGQATLSGTALALDSTGNFTVADQANLDASLIALSGQSIRFTDADVAAGAISSALEAKLGNSTRLTIRSPGAVRFSAGLHRFGDLVLDTATIASTSGTPGTAAITITGDDIRFTNTSASADGCAITAGSCGLGGALTVNATTLTFGSNDVRTSGFDGPVTLGASGGMYVEGKGSFSTGDAALTLRTPFLAERAAAIDPRDQKVRPDYALLTNAAFAMISPGGTAQAPVGNAAPGAAIAIGSIDAPVLSASIDGSLIRATAGIIDIRSKTDIALAGATLSTPGYTVTFGDTVDPVTVSAGAGTINLVALNGNLATDSATTLITDTGIGSAGALNLLASNGTIAFNAVLNPKVTGPRGGSFAFDSGKSAFDLSGFAKTYGALFGGDLAIRSGLGDLSLAADQTLRAKSVSLTSDGGAIGIAGKIDTSGASVAGLTADAARNAGVDGGDIALWGAGGVTLAATAVLDTHTTGYADTDTRPATAGDVTIGISRADAAITIATGALIDVGARRTQAAQALGESGGRLVPQIVTDPATGRPATVYRYAEPDVGGVVTVRAPVIGVSGDKVAVTLGGRISGASDVQLEGFRRYDLDTLAQSGQYSGVTKVGDQIVLNMAKGTATGGQANIFTENFALADGTPSVVRFIQDFDVTTVDGSSLAGVRLRPGVELNATGNITTETQWNLAAASFTQPQLDAAVAAGDLVVIPELSRVGSNPFYNGTDYYSVVPGHEGDLLDRFATFLYRTDGSARGEAPVVTLRAGGDLTVNRSISDGFFSFRDKSDRAYLNYQLGGGDRTYSPAISFTCGSTTPNCGNIATYQPGAPNPPNSQTLTIALSVAAQQGDISSGNALINSPLALLGNGAAGSVDAAGNPIGDPLGFAELFPLLPDNSTMHSSDIRLVAGTDATPSANILHVDRARAADVTVGGEFSYRYLPVAGTATYAGAVQFRLQQADPGSEGPINFYIGDTLNQTLPTAGLNQLTADKFTSFSWGSSLVGLSADARAAAITYFAGKGYQFVGPANAPTGIFAPLGDVLGFLKSFEPTYRQGIATNRPGYNKTTIRPSLISFGTITAQSSAANVRSVVRTGDGNIAVAAARDIDLQGTPNPEYRQENGTIVSTAATGSQFGGAAVYSAGVRVAPVAIDARIINGGDRVSIMPDSPYFVPVAESAEFIPSPKALSDTQPVLADGGGDVTLEAGRDVLGRRDLWSETNLVDGRDYGAGANLNTTSDSLGTIGLPTQLWRLGSIGFDTEIGLSPRYFTSGVGALAGGDVTIRAGRDARELIVALDSGVSTTTTSAGAALLTFGQGDLSLVAGRDILAGRFDVATGSGAIHADRDIAANGTELGGSRNNPVLVPQYLRVRLTDAVVDLSARGSALLGSVSALGVDRSSPASTNAAGFFSAAASFALTATETARIVESGAPGDFGKTQTPPFFGGQNSYIQVLPPSLAMTSLTGSVVLPSVFDAFGLSSSRVLYPSPIGQLRLLSAGDINNLTISMSDADPSLLGGVFAVPPFDQITPYSTVAGPNASDAQLRVQHNRFTTHLGDAEPVRIYTNGSINRSTIDLAKQARITAGGNIVDMFFTGQNVAATDVTRIRAGGDIRGTIAGITKPFVVSNDFILGGPGTLIVEAGRDIGPFVTSATIPGSNILNPTVSYGGGIRSVGNDINPWLAPAGADVNVRFGIAAGADYTALRQTYLDPANAAMLDGDLFAQNTDAFGNQTPDRTRPIYTPLLAAWLRDKQPTAFAALFGDATAYADTDAGNAALATAAYGKAGDLYAAFAALDLLTQQDFLINRLYFNELAETAKPDSPSYLQYIRGYRAVQTLFPTSLGYTDNLAPYTLDPATITADHPLGEPVRNIVYGQPQRATRVLTGNVDLRLATIQTGRGGDVTILGPGGDVIAGSVVRTSDQPQRRNTNIDSHAPARDFNGTPFSIGRQIQSIPLGFEGILTLRGGQVRSFTDGDLRLNQSRVFTQSGGNITMWSSNGDLNAGQGPKSASSFPPVELRFDPNGLSEINSAGSVAGAGIGTFKRFPTDPASDVILIAPVGEVDAGDAGVRASGNIFVAAARVANADNFKAAGDITGVPSSNVVATTITPANAASAITAQLANAAAANKTQDNRRSLITVDVLGAATDDARCDDPENKDNPDCSKAPQRQ